MGFKYSSLPRNICNGLKVELMQLYEKGRFSTYEASLSDLRCLTIDDKKFYV